MPGKSRGRFREWLIRWDSQRDSVSCYPAEHNAAYPVHGYPFPIRTEDRGNRTMHVFEFAGQSCRDDYYAFSEGR